MHCGTEIVVYGVHYGVGVLNTFISIHIFFFLSFLSLSSTSYLLCILILYTAMYWKAALLLALTSQALSHAHHDHDEVAPPHVREGLLKKWDQEVPGPPPPQLIQIYTEYVY